MNLYSDIFSPMATLMLTKLPAIISAVLVLLVGWVLARSVARLIGRLVHKLAHSKRIEGLAEVSDGYRVDEVVSKGVYYLLMVFVLVLAAEVLGLSAVMGPFLSMTTELTMAIPKLLKAGLLLLVAWVAAALLRSTTSRLLGARLVGQTLSRMGVIEQGEQRQQLVVTASRLVYYLVLLLFLPAVLSALQIEGLRGPLEGVTTQIAGFLPRLLAAAVPLLIGYVAARLVREVATHFLASTGVDALPGKVGMEQVFRTAPLSRVAGTILFVLIMLPVAISALESLEVEAISGPAVHMLTVVLSMVPNVAMGLLLLGVGIALARWAGSLITALVESLHIPRLLVRLGVLQKEETDPPVAVVIGRVASGILILLILVEVFDILRLTQFSAIMRQILAYLPNALVAVVILTAGWGVGQFLGRSLEAVLANTRYPAWLGTVGKAAIMTVAAMMALEQLGVAESIVVNAFTILLGSIGLATALALGLGARDAVQRWIDEKTRT